MFTLSPPPHDDSSQPFSCDPRMAVRRERARACSLNQDVHVPSLFCGRGRRCLKKQCIGCPHNLPCLSQRRGWETRFALFKNNLCHVSPSSRVLSAELCSAKPLKCVRRERERVCSLNQDVHVPSSFCGRQEPCFKELQEFCPHYLADNLRCVQNEDARVCFQAKREALRLDYFKNKKSPFWRLL